LYVYEKQNIKTTSSQRTSVGHGSGPSVGRVGSGRLRFGWVAPSCVGRVGSGNRPVPKYLINMHSTRSETGYSTTIIHNNKKLSYCHLLPCYYFFNVLLNVACDRVRNAKNLLKYQRPILQWRGTWKTDVESLLWTGSTPKVSRSSHWWAQL